MSEQARARIKIPDTKMPKAVPPVRSPEGSLSKASHWGRVIQLHRSVGNTGVERLFRSGVFQAKLKIGKSNDIYEQEANRVAEQVMRMPAFMGPPKPT